MGRVLQYLRCSSPASPGVGVLKRGESNPAAAFCCTDHSLESFLVLHTAVPEPRCHGIHSDQPVPATTKQVRQFLGITGYCRHFVHGYARHAEPLFVHTKKDEECQAAVDFLKHSITSAPVLRFPEFSRPFFIRTDACDAGLGAALMQKYEDGKDVSVASHALHKSVKPYSTPEKECLAVIWALDPMSKIHRPTFLQSWLLFTLVPTLSPRGGLR
uniref:Reverse transcriptase/retrotransposon-derived protein RNase H-like domain-containing protein n=1 Tax=Oreochromis niloticus TaxID=8128 RepID=A0A669DD44_ORENI